jgi:hypothetical protein
VDYCRNQVSAVVLEWLGTVCGNEPGTA